MNGKYLLTCMAAVLSVLPVACGHMETAASGGVQGSFFPIDIYQGPLDHLSAVRAGTCPMHPSCSEYSRQCIREFGPLIGWVMTCDRLMRCGRDELASSPTIHIDGAWKTQDPPEANVLWVVPANR